MLELQVMLELEITRIKHDTLNGFIKDLGRDQTIPRNMGYGRINVTRVTGIPLY